METKPHPQRSDPKSMYSNYDRNHLNEPDWKGSEPQEWTVKTVTEIANLKYPAGIALSSCFKRIADAHKAALDAAIADVDKDRIAACNNYIDALTQLKAERETIEMLHRQRQAAERQRDSVIRQADLAYTKGARDQHMEDLAYEQERYEILERSIRDLSHPNFKMVADDARKPLVEALEAIDQLAYGHVKGAIGKAQQIARAALASVKE